MVSLGHTGRRRVVSGHTSNTQILTKTNKQKSHNALRKFTILCWAAFIAILGCMRPVGRRLDTPAIEASWGPGTPTQCEATSPCSPRVLGLECGLSQDVPEAEFTATATGPRQLRAQEPRASLHAAPGPSTPVVIWPSALEKLKGR